MAKRTLNLPASARELLQRPAARAAFDESREVAEICRTLARARKESPLSQERLAELSGIPQAEISRIESGLLSRGPTLLTLVRLARAMGQSLRIEFEKRDASTPGVVTVVAHTVPFDVQVREPEDFGVASAAAQRIPVGADYERS